ncbi:prepilin-type cleavage/methylation domain-containing protein [Rhodopirellula sp. SM50]|nr:prepilin-type cleavage/methylation domain-containing protein [Rhodopirellula sp. SM50]PAY15434.1 prepilin-type cleavage/methylation domain-containing protein [Rhodopirellula sp. SM50]
MIPSNLTKTPRFGRFRRRRGFTLLELFLTLSMAVVLMTLVNAAFRFYAVDMDSSDMDMRRTMLAAAVMQMIEDDLRASLHPEPLDTSALETLLASTAASATGGGNTGDAGDPGDAEAAGMDDPTLEEELTTSVSGVAVLQTPGLIGDQYQLQVDTSRLPRLEEYAVLMDVDPGNLADLPSDLKTVTYYVQAADSIGIEDPLAKLDATTSTTAGGLVRRVLDRSATTFASTSGNLAALGQTGELLAPEVTGIEFSYWDGVTWQIEWNSDELGELPLAVKIQMVMVDPLVAESEQEPRVFQHVVKLTMAKIIEEEDEEDLSGVGL